MGRNYRCWIVGGLRARAPVKCLCFPPCLPSKDLHILTHYGVLWSWSAWLPQPAITLIASKKLKSFKALWPHSWGKMYVCFSPSPSLSHSLSLSAAAVARGLGYCGFSIYTACLRLSRRRVWREKVCVAEALFVSPLQRCFLLSRIHVKAWMVVVFLQLAHFPSTINCVFLFLHSSLTCTHRRIVWLTTFSLTASLVYLSDSVVCKSYLEVGCVCLRACVCVCVSPKR